MIPALSQNSLPVGILMNRASFPRLPGDIGNPATFPFAVRYRMVPGTTYHDVVEALQEERLLVPFIAAAQALEQEGVCAITTSCGFLALFQRQLSAAVRVSGVLEEERFKQDMEESFHHKFAAKPQVVAGNMAALMQAWEEGQGG